jgi:WhiB family redox-sensing transcriptional regulator
VTPTDPDAWRQRAACREYDPEIFFPDPGDASTREAAIRICRGCPVVAECRTEATSAPWGIWGGETHNQRAARTGTPARVAAARELRNAHLRPCGTPAAYMRHLRANEKPCQRCVDANRLAVNERYEKSVERRTNR